LKTDIRINYSVLEEIRDNIKKYKDAIETIKIVLSSVNKKLEGENEGQAINALKVIHTELKTDLEGCQGELDDLYNIFNGYISEMQDIIKPINPTEIMQVDRTDIWWNMESIFGNCDGVGLLKFNIGAFRSLPNFFKSEEEKANEESNSRKLEEIWDIIKIYKDKLDDNKDEMQSLFNNKIVPYEDKDDEYQTRAAGLHSKYSNTWESIIELNNKACDILENTVKGAFDSLVALVTGLVALAEYCLVKGVLTNSGSGQAITIMQEAGDVPEWLQGSIDRSNEFDKGILAIVKDPTLIAEGIAQSSSDAYEEKGIAYCIGYAGAEIAQVVVPWTKISKSAEASKISKLEKAAIKLKSGFTQAERLKCFGKLKAGVIEDTAWKKLSKYAKKEKIDLNSISWDEKMSMINKFKSDIIADLDSMEYIESNANELLKLSDIRLEDCVKNGYNAEDYYRILNQDKAIRNSEEYLKTLENTKLIKDWKEAFYGNNSKVVISYMPKDAYDNFVLGYGTIGRQGEKGGQFVLPQKIGDAIESKIADLGSISDSTAKFKVQLAKELGLPDDVFVNGVVRVEIPLDGDINLHVVTGIEDGCNYQWIPGGKTLGGTKEGIIRQITKIDDPELYDKIISNVKR
jgi:hypothetical protein